MRVDPIHWGLPSCEGLLWWCCVQIKSQYLLFQISIGWFSMTKKFYFLILYIYFFEKILGLGPPSPQTASPMHTERGHLFIWGCIAWTAYREVLGAFSNHFDFTGSPGLGEVSVWHGTCVLYDLALGTSVAFLSVLSSANVAYS
jgi:hypothetical protein